MMRVITGSARGRRLETLPGEDVTRPTTESVKEALFSMIQFDIEGRRVLDLFAGSGQLGIEALSRGARSCTLWRTTAAPSRWWSEIWPTAGWRSRRMWSFRRPVLLKSQRDL